MDELSETIICAACSYENPLGADFCEECGSPVSATANLDPIHLIRSQGLLYRKAALGRPKLIALIGMWILLLPGIVMIPVLVLATGLSGQIIWFYPVFEMLMWVVGVVILFRATANFLRNGSKNVA